VLNLWEGFAIKPEPGYWGVICAHVFFHHLRQRLGALRLPHGMDGWMAGTVQHPAEQGEVAVVMKGGEDIGKGTPRRHYSRSRASTALLSGTPSTSPEASTAISAMPSCSSPTRHSLRVTVRTSECFRA
jgi:hypothetical protein